MYQQLPPLNSIKVFDAAARLGSFKEAANELYVTPTAVSHQIKALEQALDTLLFVRKTRHVELTQDGKRLAETAQAILYQLANTIDEISRDKMSITVSTTSAFAAMWLVPNLTKFNQLYPEINVIINTSEQLDSLKKGSNIDIAIRYGIYDEQLENSVLLTTEEITSYAAPSYIEKLDGLVEINLFETQWQNSSLDEVSWRTRLKDNKIQGRAGNIQTFNQEHHIIQAALAGQGIALVSTLLVQNAVEQGWLVQYNLAGGPLDSCGYSYYLLTPEHAPRTSVTVFKEWLLNQFIS